MFFANTTWIHKANWQRKSSSLYRWSNVRFISPLAWIRHQLFTSISFVGFLIKRYQKIIWWSRWTNRQNLSTHKYFSFCHIPNLQSFVFFHCKTEFVLGWGHSSGGEYTTFLTVFQEQVLDIIETVLSLAFHIVKYFRLLLPHQKQELLDYIVLKVPKFLTYESHWILKCCLKRSFSDQN
jgi:hypothetical protein